MKFGGLLRVLGAKSVIAKIAPGEDFDLYWKRERERELAEAAADEEVLPPLGSMRR